ncbi:ATP-binding protein [uncultured Roseobacter sp.]|uniref:hybrid sensor histidine kinase/response regulator n=1 Tax=uncultured Roseobacter sp. TaxID=114847 RepID=UPI002604E368|nr:ATP-binding protein [uncultured Roseobacter sp.]
MGMADDFKEIERARDLLRDAIESLKEGFALYDEERRLVMFNQQYAEMNKGVSDLLKPGLDWEILMRETARRGIYADAIGNEEKWVSDRLANGIQFIQDYELTETDGRTYLVSVHPTRLGGFVVTREEITDRKQAEIEERDGDLLIRKVLDASSAVVTMARVGDGQLLYRTPAALQLFGPTKTAREHYAHPEERADFVTLLLADGRVDDFKLDLLDAKGNTFPARISSQLVDYKGEEVIVTSIIDLTVQKEADALIRQVMEAYPAAINMTDAETGEILFATPDMEELFGPAQSSRSYYANPAERQRYLKELRQAGSLKDRRIEFINARGRKFWGADSSRLIEFNGKEVIVSNTRDLTDELAIEEELSKQREMLFQNEKMSALGELLAGVSHELNNPLSVVVGHSLMLKEEITDPDLTVRIDKISNAAERCAKIVKTFLAMARQQPSKIEQVDVASVIETAADVVGYGSTAGDIRIKQKIPVDLPPIAADADQITQVIINIIINAEQAMTSSGCGDLIELSAEAQPDKGTVQLTVRDNGPGIPKAIRARIFEPFFTTKEVGEGTGIGLAFCHRIILSHNGQIRLDQTDNSGTCFRITLPAADNRISEVDEPAEPISPSANLKALVVDDEVEVGELNAEILRREGFEVDVVSSGEEAINCLRTAKYDVFLSDLNMPGVDGRQIYDALVTHFPEMLSKTAYVTGDTMGQKSLELLRDSGLPYLEKPVSPSELRHLVGKLLAEHKETADG